MEKLYNCTVVVHLNIYVHNWPKFGENLSGYCICTYLIKFILIKKIVNLFICLLLILFVSTVIVLVRADFDLQLDIELWHTFKFEKLFISIRKHVHRRTWRVLLILIETHWSILEKRLSRFKLLGNTLVTHHTWQSEPIQRTHVFLRICLVF